MAQQNDMAPFRPNTRERFRKIGTIDMPSGGGDGLALQVHQVGYLARLLIVFEGTITYASGTTLGDLAPFNIVKRLKLEMNNGSQSLFDVSGFGTYLINSVMRKHGRLDKETDQDFYIVPLSGTSAAIRVPFEIPVNVSEGMNFEAGLINLQAPEVVVNLSAQFLTNLTELGSNISSLTGKLHVGYKYYEVPNPLRVFQPPVTLHRWLEEQQPVGQTGDVPYKIPSGGELLRLIQVLRLNGSRSDSYDERSIVINKNDTVYKEERRFSKLIQRDNYGYSLPVGVSCWDFNQGYGNGVEESDKRDWINTERATTIEAITTISSGATLGSNNNFLHSIREIVQALG